MHVNDLSSVIISSAIEVHKTLGGPGLLEGLYEEALAWELTDRKIAVHRQSEVPVIYKGERLTYPLRLDLLVDNRIIVEVKSVAAYNAIFEAQLLTYLRLMDLRLGLVINFGEKMLKDGVHRVANGL
ncbi:MAG: GxxExxY protein [Trichlorobacter sp.]|uniref:GxxExxY protein n=1 Tax=Trichlorobacter sp. TaxID=2911007 RepID=UPI00255D16C5|nr:GxxExxY protein [Trichlorobacter sp.]MDK9718384.1 GxxExxY protein [Trichlorobacter sp.]